MDENQKTGFSEDYVKELRQENASWRTKVRDLESKLELNEVKTELLHNGVNVNPKWVERSEGETVRDAVNRFLEEYPQFKPSTNTEPEYTEPDVAPTKPMRSNKVNSNTPGPKPKSGSYGGRGLEEIKKDPKARADLRSVYRQMLAQQSNQKYNGE